MLTKELTVTERYADIGRRILLTLFMCGVMLVLTGATAFAAAVHEQAISEENSTITVQQGYSYGTGDGSKTKITSEDLSGGSLVVGGEKYDLGKEYTLPDILLLENNFEQTDPDSYYLLDDRKFAFHILSEITPPLIRPEPPKGQWMEYTTEIELVSVKPLSDVIFTGEKTVNCYVGDVLMSNKGITVNDNGQDLTHMIRGEKVDTKKPSKITYSWYLAGKSGNMVTFTRTFIVKAKKAPAVPAAKAKAKTVKTVKTTAIKKGAGKIKISGPGKCHRKKCTLWIKTAKGKSVTLTAKGKKFKCWQKKVGGKYRKYSAKKTVKVKAVKNMTYRAVFRK